MERTLKTVTEQDCKKEAPCVIWHLRWLAVRQNNNWNVIYLGTDWFDVHYWGIKEYLTKEETRIKRKNRKKEKNELESKEETKPYRPYRSGWGEADRCSCGWTALALVREKVGPPLGQQLLLLQGIRIDQKCIEQNQAVLSFLSPCLVFEIGNGWWQEPI